MAYDRTDNIEAIEPQRLENQSEDKAEMKETFDKQKVTET